MTLTFESLRSVLRHPFRFYASVDSSNDIAKRWLLEGAPALSAVFADEQLRGRGRAQRTWLTPPNAGLAVSLILRPPPEFLPRITMIGALSVYDLANSVGCHNVGIKWPNDIMIGTKKLSGVLIESIWQGNELAGVVLGIGVNVRVDFTGAPLAGRAVNLEHVTGRRLDRTQLAQTLCDRVEHWYRRISSDEVFSLWRARLNMLNRIVSTQDIDGTAVDVTTDGGLLVRDAAGTIQELTTADIRIIACDGES